jgi:hypothetical protein
MGFGGLGIIYFVTIRLKKISDNIAVMTGSAPESITAMLT